MGLASYCAHPARKRVVGDLEGGQPITSTFHATSEVLDALIAFGWIDGRRMKLDEERTMQLIAPRQEHPNLSLHGAKTYIQRAERLEFLGEGRMQESGRAAIQQAKASDGVFLVAKIFHGRSRRFD